MDDGGTREVGRVDVGVAMDRPASVRPDEGYVAGLPAYSPLCTKDDEGLEVMRKLGFSMSPYIEIGSTVN